MNSTFPLWVQKCSLFFLNCLLSITPVPVPVITKSHGFPKANGTVPDPVSNHNPKIALAIVYKLPAIAESLPCRVDVYRVDDDS